MKIVSNTRSGTMPGR